MKHLNDPLPLPRQIDPALPSALEHIVLKVLAKDPDDRYQNTQEMAAALEQVTPEELPEGPRGIVPPPYGLTPKRFFRVLRASKLPTSLSPSRILPRPGPHTEGKNGALPSQPIAQKLPGQVQALISKPLNVPGAVLGSLGAILLINLCASMNLAITGLNVYRYGWAFEIFLVAGFLAMIMWAVQKHWMLVPIIILFGNAMILSYCAITGRWSDWVFLWMLEPLIVGAAVYIPLQIAKRVPDPSFWARAGGAATVFMSLLLASSTCGLALIIVALFR